MKQITIAEAIQRTVEHREVFHDEMLHIMRQIMRGELTPAQIAGVHHRPAREEGDDRRDRRRGAGDARVRDPGRGERTTGTWSTPAAPAATPRIRSTSPPARRSSPPRPARRWRSTCGRSVSSSSGSAEVLEALGANIAPDARSRPAQAIEKLGIGFMFAPAHHAAMKYAAPVRKELGVRTIFNILGPLTNPAGAKNQVHGRVPPRPGRHPGARAAAPGLEARDGGLRPRRAGRDLDLGRDAGRRAGEGRDQRVHHPSLAVRPRALRPARDPGARRSRSRRR